MTLFLYIAAGLVGAFALTFMQQRVVGSAPQWFRSIVIGAGGGYAFVPLFREFRRYAEPEQTSLWSAFLIGVLLIAWLLAAGVATLILLELLVPVGFFTNPVLMIQGAPSRIRVTKRYIEVLRIILIHALWPYFRYRGNPDPEAERQFAHHIRIGLQEGGVTFVKMGQILASRPDIIAPNFIDEFSKLQAEATPESWDMVRRTLESSWHKEVSDVVRDCDDAPIAAASVAQVHRATLLDGSQVAIKVQRTGVDKQVAIDSEILIGIARWLDRNTQWARRMGIVTLSEGSVEVLREELDYGVELSNIAAITEDFPTSTGIAVPRAYPELSTPRVLVMELLEGTPLSKAQDVIDALPASRRVQLAKSLTNCLLHQLVITGVFHADMHAGNVLITDEGTLAIIDYGSVGRLDRNSRFALLSMLIGVDTQDSSTTADAMIELFGRPENLNFRELSADVGQLIMKYAYGFDAYSNTSVFNDLFGFVMRYQFSVPTSVAYAFRSVGAMEGTVRRLSPDTPLVTILREQARSFATPRTVFTPIRDQIISQFASIAPLISRIPRRTDDIAHQIENGTIRIGVSAFTSPEDQRFIRHQGQRLGLVALACVTAIVGVLLAVATSGPHISSGLSVYNYLGYGSFLIAVIIATRAIAPARAATSSRRRPDRAALWRE